MKRIGIFTKLEMAGGSEFRALEMASAISSLPGYQAVLLSERRISQKLWPAIGKRVEAHERVFLDPNLEPLYSVDHLLVINSDSRHFTNRDYWLGKSERHSHPADLSKIRQMTFLFNFIVSPACQLPGLEEKVPDLRIIAANSKFFNEITQQDRYERVRHYPRLQLESPISHATIRPKTKCEKLRIGMHSLPNSDKWNSQFPEVIESVNQEFGDRIQWDFMGMPLQLVSEIRAKNVTARKEFSMPVKQFLAGIDLFLFFVSWKREEAWARSVGEALMSGCPVITTPKGGNKDQITSGNNGYLCNNVEAIIQGCQRLIECPKLFRNMATNARRSATRFTSKAVVRRFLDFIK